MDFAVICSSKDLASMSIRNVLVEKLSPEKVGTFDGFPILDCKRFRIYTLAGKSIKADGIDEKINEASLVFASKHSSASKRPSLSVHTPGNFWNADLGGKDRMICPSDSMLFKKAFQLLYKSKGCEKYDRTMEVTHHGPSLKKPALYIEIGSSEDEWQDIEAAGLIADIIIKLSDMLPSKNIPSAIGLGGTHYCANFNEIQSGEKVSIGHICPKFNLSHLDRFMLSQMIDKTIPKPSFALIDWKGMGKEKQRILALLDDMGFPYRKTKEMKNS